MNILSEESRGTIGTVVDRFFNLPPAPVDFKRAAIER
jgi:hypothetical protein